LTELISVTLLYQNHRQSYLKTDNHDLKLGFMCHVRILRTIRYDH